MLATGCNLLADARNNTPNEIVAMLITRHIGSLITTMAAVSAPGAIFAPLGATSVRVTRVRVANVGRVGVGARGVGVRPGTPWNRGGPVNRVGRRRTGA